MREAINEIAQWIERKIPESQKKRLYKKLEKIGGKTGKDSIFQKAADKIKGWKPYAFANVIVKLISVVFKSPIVAKLAVKGFGHAQEFQDAIDTKNLEPEEAGSKLRDVLKKDASILTNSRVPDWIINFLAEGVVLALKILRGLKTPS